LASNWQRGEHSISTDPARIDVDAVHEYLTSSYWANGITRDAVVRSLFMERKARKS
jgi:hypothetical protein